MKPVGDTIHEPTDIYVGMTFPNRNTFKLHMALYAIDNKFKFRSPKLATNLMLLECCGVTCPWRVYTIRLDNSEIYEVLKVKLTHCCTVNEQTNYQRLATTSVIGDMMRSKYLGTGNGPRPNDIRDMMRSDHNVRISYWKAWRSREVAMDYVKGSSGQSYTRLPSYL